MRERKKFEIIRRSSEILNKFKERKDSLITIVDLTLPQKRGTIRVYLSVYPKNFEKETISFLKTQSRSILKEIRENVYLRYLPSKILFYPSDEFEKADQVLRLIDKLSSSSKNNEAKEKKD